MIWTVDGRILTTGDFKVLSVTHFVYSKYSSMHPTSVSSLIN